MLCKLRCLCAMACAALLGGCVTTPEPYDFTLFYAEAPRSILVVPAINESVDVDAPDYLLSTISVPLAEKGYYVFPVNTVKNVLEGEGLYDANLIHDSDPVMLGNMFGADAILYLKINEWDAEYVLVSTTVTVNIGYRLMSGKSGEELWSAQKTMQYTPNNSSSSGSPAVDLFAMALSAAIVRADPNYIPLAQQANTQVLFVDQSKPPPGPYAVTAEGSATAEASITTEMIDDENVAETAD